jgi:spermidine synthase
MSAQTISRSPAASHALTAVVFSASIFTSAALLFWVQPLVARMLLPLLGGSPSVWNTCMLFFQAMLLGGYAYALAVSRRLSLRRQGALQLALLAAAGLTLPFAISEDAVRSIPIGGSPAPWLLGALLLTVGPSFFILSTNAPLMQRWFSRTDHPSAHDPYFLYALSNAGSLISLLAFPFLLEPALDLRSQSRLWAGGFLTLFVCVLSCAAVLWRRGLAPAHADEKVRAVAPVSWRARGAWALLSFIPSSLLLGVTTHISTDVASFPLVWISPLALYLLTFIMAFARRQHISLRLVSLLLPALMVALGIVETVETGAPQWAIILLHLALFFFASLLCHMRLAERRPPVTGLAEFYLWIAVGGVLGGVFNAVLAPVIFTLTIEYPLVLLLAAMTRPAPVAQGRGRAADWALPACVILAAVALQLMTPRLGLKDSLESAVIFGPPLVLCYFLTSRRPRAFALTLAALAALGYAFPQRQETTLYRERNFFGRWHVTADGARPLHRISHGTTIHGMQYTEQEKKCAPLSYYHERGPLGGLLSAYNDRPASPNVAVVGLGAGTMAAYSRPGQSWDFYEIDPAVVRIASDPSYFTYLKDCASAPYRIILGDARQRLREAPAAHYGLIVLDAFSSDSIPAHLVTREALELYRSKLSAGGMMVFHISNRYFDLAPLFAGLAREADLTARVFMDDDSDTAAGKYPSRWLVLARRPEDLGALAQDQRWVTPDGDVVWTDDYSNIVGLIKW